VTQLMDENEDAHEEKGQNKVKYSAKKRHNEME
jgi:hypothetical protein